MSRFIRPPRHRTPLAVRWRQIAAVACVLYAPPVLIAQVAEYAARTLHH